jgi:hypothetical protein
VTRDQPSLEYSRAHLEEALATDARVAEQGTYVEIEDERLVVRGTVSTPQRRMAVDDVARGATPGVEVRNETTVVDLTEPDHEESIT